MTQVAPVVTEAWPLENVESSSSSSSALIPFQADDSLNIFGLTLPENATIDQRLDLIDTLQGYIGVQCVKFDDLEKFFSNKHPAAIIDILGAVIKPMGLFASDGRFYDKVTGQERHGWVTLIKFRQGENTEPRILLFNSRAATDYVKLLMAAFGCVTDFPYAMSCQITQVPAKVGHTYLFNRVKKG